jgi:YD repeat-containing protein
MNLNSGTSTDPNVVVYLTVIDAKDSNGNPLYRTIHALNNDGHELRRANIENPNATTLNVVCTSKKLNSLGEVIEERPAEAHALVNSNALLTQFLNPYNGSSWANDTVTLEQSKGIIYITEYDSVTNKKSGSKVIIGSSGTGYYINATDYNTEGQVSAEYIYPTQTTNREASDRVTTTFSYTYWENNFKQAIKTKTETKQAVPTTQNGSGVSPVTQTYYDSYGKIHWTRDPIGVVTYYGYHPISTQQTLIVRDVDTSSLPAIITTDTENITAWSGSVPFTREVSLSTAFNQTSTIEYDKRGRIFATTNPAGVTSYTISDVRKTMRFSAWDETTQKPILPIDITETNAAGKILESYQLPPTTVTITNGKPMAFLPMFQ